MKIYIVRHGTTVWNEKKITQGYFKNRLSKKGKEELENIALSIKEENIDVIFSSPLVRAVQSANIINKYHEVKVIKYEKLIGIDQGVFAGRYWKSLSEKERELHQKRDESCRMESYSNVYIRTQKFIEDVIDNCKYENIVIVTHNTNATALEHLILKKEIDFDDVSSLNKFDNGQLKVVEYLK